jgi:tetratricopeptide (TPR) repeat protein
LLQTSKKSKGMKKKIVFLLLILVSQISIAQTNYQVEFSKFCELNDTTSQKQLLEKWEKEKPNDAELQTSYFNYYLAKSKKEVIGLTQNEKKDNLSQASISFGRQTYYNNQDFTKGIEHINKGIKNFPNRLDMRFGKIYALGSKKMWTEYTEEVIKAIEFSNKNANQWTWTNHEPVKDSKKFFFQNVQGYTRQLYNTENDDLLVNMRQICEATLKHYPNHVQSLTNIAITYLVVGEHDKGIQILLKAEKINPKDYIVLGNIAQAYKNKGDKKRAIKYHQKTIKYGDESAKKYSKEQIKELKK